MRIPRAKPTKPKTGTARRVGEVTLVTFLDPNGPRRYTCGTCGVPFYSATTAIECPACAEKARLPAPAKNDDPIEGLPAVLPMVPPNCVLRTCRACGAEFVRRADRWGEHCGDCMRVRREWRRCPRCRQVKNILKGRHVCYECGGVEYG